MSQTANTLVIDKPTEKLQKLINVMRERKRAQIQELRSAESCTFNISL